jgi:hypothetical protein
MKKTRGAVALAHLVLPATRDPEVERLLRPQPPLPVPTRTPEATRRGLLAHQLLGHRVITRVGDL